VSVIVGVGVDVVSTQRFADALARTPGLLHRVFHPDELAAVGDDVARLAARFAAKEAVAKALGAPPGLTWHDCVVRNEPDGRPRLEISGTVAAAADRLGAVAWHLSLTHDAGISAAYVIAEAKS
jgi:holo-[acyl-carrier protein] synthase